MADYGYDVADYCDVDPIFGTLADFDALIARAHELGIKVTIDLVFAHTSDQHAWFAASRASKDSIYSDWYVWHDANPDGAAQQLAIGVRRPGMDMGRPAPAILLSPVPERTAPAQRP
jgi:glycosidase